MGMVLTPRKGFSWLMPEAGLVVSFRNSKNPKLRDRAFESSTFTQVDVAARFRHVTPVCRLLGIGLFSWALSTMKWNRSVDPGAIFLFGL